MAQTPQPVAQVPVDPSTFISANGRMAVDVMSGGSSPVTAPTATITSVASAAISTPFLPSNVNRKGATIHNDSTAVLYVACAGTASVSAFTFQLASQGYWEMPPPIYTGAISGIWAAANGFARITEF